MDGQIVDVTDPEEVRLAKIPKGELLHIAPQGLDTQDNDTKREWLRGGISRLISQFCPRLKRLELKGVTSCDLWNENADWRQSMASLGYHRHTAYPETLVSHIEQESKAFHGHSKSQLESSLGTSTSPRYCAVCSFAHPSYIGGVPPDHATAEQVLLKTMSVQCGDVMVVYQGFGFDYCDHEELRCLREKGSLVQLQNVLCSLRRSFLHTSPDCGICMATLCI